MLHARRASGESGMDALVDTSNHPLAFRGVGGGKGLSNTLRGCVVHFVPCLVDG